jgi:hypothetical protein
LDFPTCLLNLGEWRFAFARASGDISSMAVSNVTPDTKVDWLRALVIWYGRVCLYFHKLRDDVTVTNSRCEVESGVASLIPSIHHLLHESHQPNWLGVIVLERHGLATADVAPHKVF